MDAPRIGQLIKKLTTQKTQNIKKSSISSILSIIIIIIIIIMIIIIIIIIIIIKKRGKKVCVMVLAWTTTDFYLVFYNFIECFSVLTSLVYTGFQASR